MTFCLFMNLIYVVCFLLGDSPASEIYMPTFRKTLSIPKTSAYKIQKSGNHPKDSIEHSVHGESLKSRKSNSARHVLGNNFAQLRKL